MRRGGLACAALVVIGLAACGDDSGAVVDGGGLDGGATADAGFDAALAADAGPMPDAALLRLRAVTFNTGTNPGLAHDDPPDDGYDSGDAALSDTYYGDGLAWVPAVEATERFFAETAPDVVAFQEIFYSGDCPAIPTDAYREFVCETWTPGAPTVTNVILGAGYQVACHVEHPDKCIGVRRAFGTLRGCDADLCLDGLAGAEIAGCGGGARVGRGVIDLVAGGSITVVNMHGSSGIAAEDIDCRLLQVEQVFVDLGDGAPAASGERNVVLGDLNMDPGRFETRDAMRFSDFVGDGHDFHFVTDVGADAVPTYAAFFNIDHVVSDVFVGSCWAAGITPGHPPVTDAVYFDHKPIVCDLALPLP